MTNSPSGNTSDAAGSPPYRPGYQRAVQAILDLIVEEKLTAGDRLPTERELATVLGIGRSVVREAVKILSAVGRLSVEKGRGIFVADAPSAVLGEASVHFQPTDPDQVHAVFELRRAIETLAAQSACERAAPAQVRAIAAAAERTAIAAEEQSSALFAEADRAFHLTIAEAAGNEFLVTIVRWLEELHRQMSVMAMTAAPAALRVAAGQHIAIARAISLGDGARASDLVVEHIRMSQDQVSQIIRDRVFSDAPPRESSAPA